MFLVEQRKDIEINKISGLGDIHTILDSVFAKESEKEVTLVIDYSCMTKSWYYAIILYLSQIKSKKRLVRVYFTYTPSKYAAPLEPKPNTEIGPLPGKYLIPTDKPKALIVCLGYERQKAEGIIDHLDPHKYFLFYSKPALDAKFVQKVEDNNKSIIEASKDVVNFPLNDLAFIERELMSIYWLLKDNYNIIIAPLGPKPFTLVAMLLSIKYRDIDIWRVGSGSDINEYDRESIDNDTFIINELHFISK